MASSGGPTAASVGLRELKQNLSAYLHRAQRGEAIYVTERGVPMAQIMPIPDMDRIREGIDAGRITPPKNGWGGLRRLPPFTPVKATMTVQEMFDEDRGE
jgi:prevent-host-death family protein